MSPAPPRQPGCPNGAPAHRERRRDGSRGGGPGASRHDQRPECTPSGGQWGLLDTGPAGPAAPPDDPQTSRIVESDRQEIATQPEPVVTDRASAAPELRSRTRVTGPSPCCCGFGWQVGPVGRGGGVYCDVLPRVTDRMKGTTLTRPRRKSDPAIAKVIHRQVGIFKNYC